MENSENITLDGIEESINAFDNNSENGYNPTSAENDESAPTGDEKAQALEALGDQVAALKADNERLLAAVDKMVRLYGARISAEDARGVEAFPKDPMRVEPTFDTGAPDVPPLDQIQLS